MNGHAKLIRLTPTQRERIDALLTERGKEFKAGNGIISANELISRAIDFYLDENSIQLNGQETPTPAA